MMAGISRVFAKLIMYISDTSGDTNFRAPIEPKQTKQRNEA